MSAGMSDCAVAYLAEYGTVPGSRDEQDRYSAFRLGYEAGQRRGRARALRDAMAQLENAARLADRIEQVAP